MLRLMGVRDAMTFVRKGTENKEKMITNNRDKDKGRVKDKDKEKVRDTEVVLMSAMVGREPRTSRDVR